MINGPPPLSHPRRAFLLAGLATMATCSSLASAAAGGTIAPSGGRLNFHVFRKDKKIGEHLIAFTSVGDAITMRADVQMTVGLGPVTLFRYRHQQTERWTAGRFASLQTDTTQNGAKFRIEAERTDTGVTLEGAKGGTRTLGVGSLPLTHWNRASLNGPLFNPQDGKVMRLSVSQQGPAPFVLANGQAITATRIALVGETSIEDFYDAGGVWTGLRAKAQDGSIIEYRRT